MGPLHPRKMLRLVATLALSVASAHGWADETAQLVSSRPIENASFGFALASAGDWLAVGAPGEDEAAGAVYLFHCNGQECGLSLRVVAPERDDDAQFGAAIAAQPGRIVVGSPGDGHGAVDVFTLIGDQWQHEMRLSAFDGGGGDRFGHALAIDGNSLLVGAPRANLSRGAAYAFQRGPNAWQQSSLIVPPALQPGDRFGHALAMDSGRLWIGSPMHDSDGIGPGHSHGAVHAFVDTGTWTYAERLEGANSGDRFGWSVALDGTRGAAGAPGADAERGSIRLSQFSAGSWVAGSTLAREPGRTGDRFGWHVSHDGGNLFAGYPLAGLGYAEACGTALHLVENGSSFDPKDLRMRLPGLADLVGWAVARSGDRIMVGVPGLAIGSEAGAGGVLVFDFASNMQRDGFEGGSPGCD